MQMWLKDDCLLLHFVISFCNELQMLWCGLVWWGGVGSVYACMHSPGEIVVFV